LITGLNNFKTFPVTIRNFLPEALPDLFLFLMISSIFFRIVENGSGVFFRISEIVLKSFSRRIQHGEDFF